MEAVISPSDPDALRNARIALREALHSWSLEALSDTAELLACELATNALLHTDGSATLTARPVRHSGRGLRLAVSDTSTASPRRRAALERATSGRGMMLVEELGTAWGIEPRGNGKTVWCELSLDLV
ncbi:ATP-binding protein [Streptomyces aureus]